MLTEVEVTKVVIHVNVNEEDDEITNEDDDEIPTKQVSQDIMEEVSLTIDEAKLKKNGRGVRGSRSPEGLRCTSAEDTTPLIQSCQRDPEAPALSLINQDLLYLKKGSLGPKKIILSLHKFPSIIFNDDDIKECTSRWFVTEIVARRANECIVLITKPDYKNLNKNNIEDMYLLIMNGKVPDYAETGLLWSLSVFIRSSVIWERVHDFQLGIENYQQKVNLTAPTIVLEGLKSYNNDVKYGYVQRELTNDEVEYLKLFEEEIKVRLKHRNQMRRWEIRPNSTARLIKAEARMSREAWGRSMDASDLARAEVMSLRTQVVAQQAVITELQAADHKRQATITEMLAVDRRRQKQFIEALKLLKRLQTQMTEFER
ncbi:hypothetical protein Tco_0303487 [Tanacetum coccineum]